MAQIEQTELRLAEIRERYCEPGFFETDEAPKLRAEESKLEAAVAKLMERWEELEAELAGAEAPG